MNYLKFSQYIYLIAGILIAYKGFTLYQAGDNQNAIFMGLLAFIGIFMFFFRRRYAKRFEDRNKKS